MEITCARCKAHYHISYDSISKKIQYCSFCGFPLPLPEEKTETSLHSQESSPSLSSATIVPGHKPDKESVQFTLDSFQIIKEVGKGGMGEVFLAYDTDCGRRIALKRIRSDPFHHTSNAQPFCQGSQDHEPVNASFHYSDLFHTYQRKTYVLYHALCGRTDS